MDTLQAIDWIDLHKAMFGDSPGIIGYSEDFVKMAGSLCFKAMSAGSPVTNADVYWALGEKPPGKKTDL